MITVNPQGLVYLCKTPLENDYKNQLTFANATAQLNYFNSKVVKSFDNYTYIRKDNTIKVGVPIDEIINCNYLFYQNKGFTSKYYYCFITDMAYVNENCTLITIETDVYQTWYFDINYKACYVEREHVNDDTVGLHTIPEGLETGDYICSYKNDIYTSGKNTYIIIATTEVPTEISLNPFNTTYNGVYSGTKNLAFDSALDATNFIRAMDGLGKGDAVINVFLAPQGLCNNVTFNSYDVEVQDQSGHYITFRAGIVPYSTNATSLATSANFNPTNSFEGYIPKNNKLFVYPYTYLYLTNNIGNDAVFHYEDFVNNTASFKVIGALTIGCSIKAYPVNYKKLSDTANTANSFSYGIVGAKYPVCSWTSDSYTNWLTQNSINIAGFTLNAKEAGYFKGGAKILTGGVLLGTGDTAGGGAMMGSGAKEIFDTMQENYQRDIIPLQSKGSVSAGDITFSSGNTSLPIYEMCIRQEYARCIDGYFSAFGYKVNSFKIPNITGRANWNYVKTIDCNFEGDIPQEDLNKIKNIFNAGVTLWHNPATMYDYTANNGIV